RHERPARASGHELRIRRGERLPVRLLLTASAADPTAQVGVRRVPAPCRRVVVLVSAAADLSLVAVSQLVAAIRDQEVALLALDECGDDLGQAALEILGTVEGLQRVAAGHVGNGNENARRGTA